MRYRTLQVTMLAAALSAAAMAFAEAPDASPDRIARLVGQLGSARFAERETASRALDAIGEPALNSLKAAVATSDPETRRRAAELVERIGQRVASDRLLKPTAISLHFRDAPLDEAVKSLAKQTGLAFELSSASKFAGRKVTIQSDPLPVWDAVELFCRKADLHEWDGFTSTGAGTTTDTAARPGNVAFGGIQGQVIINGRVINRGGVTANPKLLLLDGPGALSPRHMAGAVRLRVLPHGTPFPHAMNSGEVILPMQISAESRLQWVGATAVRIDKATNESGEPVDVSGLVASNAIGEDVAWVAMPNGNLVQQTATRLGPVALRVLRGGRDVRQLREVTGQVTGQVRVSSSLLKLAAPFKSGAAASAGGVSLKLTEVSEPTPGEIKLSAEIGLPADVQIAGIGNGIPNGRMAFQGGVIVQQLVVQGNARPAASSLPAGATEFAGLAIDDDKGHRWQAVSGLQDSIQFGPQGMTAQVSVTFKSPAADAVPASLTVTGSRPLMLAVPFVFRDVPLP